MQSGLSKKWPGKGQAATELLTPGTPYNISPPTQLCNHSRHKGGSFFRRDLSEINILGFGLGSKLREPHFTFFLVSNYYLRN